MNNDTITIMEGNTLLVLTRPLIMKLLVLSGPLIMQLFDVNDAINLLAIY